MVTGKLWGPETHAEPRGRGTCLFPGGVGGSQHPPRLLAIDALTTGNRLCETRLGRRRCFPQTGVPGRALFPRPPELLGNPPLESSGQGQVSPLALWLRAQSRPVGSSHLPRPDPALHHYGPLGPQVDRPGAEWPRLSRGLGTGPVTTGKMYAWQVAGAQ